VISLVSLRHPQTIAWTVSFELVGFCFFLIFSFPCHALD